MKRRYPRFFFSHGAFAAYTRRVLEVASLNPAGYIASYGSIAKAAGGSPRAVGNVMARKLFASIVR